MADGAKNPIGGTFETINEAVVKPMTDEVGRAIEQGVQSVIGVPKPQQPNQNQQNPQPSSLTPTPTENAKMLEARRKLDWWKRLDSEQKQVREAKKQQQAQVVQQVQKKKEEIEQFKIVKKKDSIALQQAKNKTEVRGGVGG